MLMLTVESWQIILKETGWYQERKWMLWLSSSFQGHCILCSEKKKKASFFLIVNLSSLCMRNHTWLRIWISDGVLNSYASAHQLKIQCRGSLETNTSASEMLCSAKERIHADFHLPGCGISFSFTSAGPDFYQFSTPTEIPSPRSTLSRLRLLSHLFNQSVSIYHKWLFNVSLIP